MKKHIGLMALIIASAISLNAQQVDFEEYDLDNGLHVILHQDNSAPVVTVSTYYHVGSKNEDPERTGFAHFFEHLLFEESVNIPKGERDKIVSANGGSGNAYTTQDKTYYYENLPSNQLALGLWLEAEQMRHPIIGQVGVDTQNEVVKEEKRMRVDNSPYGQWTIEMFKNLFTKHPYNWAPIGSMEHLDNATLEEFQAFHKKFYIPNNAVLTVAGDIDIKEAKNLIHNYFSSIPKGLEIQKVSIKEDPIETTIKAKYEDPNIQIPAIFTVYRTPSIKEHDAYVFNMISSILTSGKSSRLYKKLVDDKKMALEVAAFNYSLEDYGSYIILALPLGENTLDDLLKEMDEEVVKLQTELISENDYQKLQNIFENQFVNSNSSVSGIAESLSEYYVMHEDTDLINSEIEIYRSITREEIRDVAKKYLNKNQRLELEYLPKPSETTTNEN